MGGRTAGARLNKTPEEGEALLENFFKGFPGVKQRIDWSRQFLKDNGYIEDFYGRRRHLPEIYLPKYEVKFANPALAEKASFNPFINCANRTVDDPLIIKWNKKVQEAIDKSQVFQEKQVKKYNEDPENASKPKKVWTQNGEMSNKSFKKLATEAIKEGILLIANTGRIAQAERQCFNASIQGGAATLTKLAMVDIANDKVLNDCQAELIIPVHDELLVECPAFYADLVEKRLPEVMIAAAKHGGISVPQACDPYNVYRWYNEEMSAAMIDTYAKLQKEGMARNDILKHIQEEHEEIPIEAVIDLIDGKTEELIF